MSTTNLRRMRGRVAVTVLVAALACLAAPSPAPAQDQQRSADDTIAAAKRAGQNAVELAKHIRNGDQAAADKLLKQEINIGGKPTKRTRQSWTMTSRDGITVVAASINKDSNSDPDVQIEDDAVSMWGKVKSVDVKTRTVTLEDVELIYAEKLKF